MKRILLISILIVLVTFTGQAQKIVFQNVSARKFQSLILEDNNHLLIDVSTSTDKLDGHIPDAISAETSEKLFSILDTTPASRPILIYCKYGKRSQRAGWLIKEKYPHQVYSLKGGFEVWKEKELGI